MHPNDTDLGSKRIPRIRYTLYIVYVMDVELKEII